MAANRAVRYECDSAGTALNYSVMSNIISGVRKSASAQAMGAMLDESEALDEIKEDYKNRHR